MFFLSQHPGSSQLLVRGSASPFHFVNHADNTDSAPKRARMLFESLLVLSMTTRLKPLSAN